MSGAADYVDVHPLSKSAAAPPMPQDAARLLAGYAAAHFLVDASCAAVLFRMVSLEGFSVVGAWALVLTYDFLAFGIQPFVGLAVDRRRAARLAAALGCMLTALPVAAVEFSVVFAICLAGIGNALFHVGAGAVSLNLTPRRCAGPGVFIAPGALGLVLGATMGAEVPAILWILAVLLVAAGMFILGQGVPQTRRDCPDAPRRMTGPELVVILLLLSTVIRSVVGLTMAFEAKLNMTWLVILAFAAAAGKASGGILADRFGWRRVAVAAMLISLPLVSFGAPTAYLAVLGMLLFQIPTGVIVVAIAAVFPGRPAFAFGLTCLALVTGAFPVFTELREILTNHWVSLSLASASTVALWVGLPRVPDRPHTTIASSTLVAK